jgi:hypothetical protein
MGTHSRSGRCLWMPFVLQSKSLPQGSVSNADSEKLAYARNLDVHQLDSTLSHMRLEDWLRSLTGPSIGSLTLPRNRQRTEYQISVRNEVGFSTPSFRLASYSGASTQHRYSSCGGPLRRGTDSSASSDPHLRFDHERSQNWSASRPNCKAPPTPHSAKTVAVSALSGLK